MLIVECFGEEGTESVQLVQHVSFEFVSLLPRDYEAGDRKCKRVWRRENFS